MSWYNGFMAERGHYNRTCNELEIDSEVIEGLQYCIKNGNITMHTEDENGDTTFPTIRLKDMAFFLQEVEEIYDVYVHDVHNMKFLEESTKD